MNFKRIIPAIIGLSLIGILPKILQKPVADYGLLCIYFLYILFGFVAFLFINWAVWAWKPQFDYWLKFGSGLFIGTLVFSLLHYILFYTNIEWLTYFLNLRSTSPKNIFKLTLFRGFLAQSICFACLFLLKNKKEKDNFQLEIEQLNKYLEDLRNNKVAEKTYKETVLVRFQDKVLPIGVSDIAFFHLAESIVFQYLFSGKKYIQNVSLESLESELNPSIFFRANRQFLLHRKSVEKVEQMENRKLKVLLTQPTSEEIVVSKAKSSAFIRWLEIK